MAKDTPRNSPRSKKRQEPDTEEAGTVTTLDLFHPVTASLVSRGLRSANARRSAKAGPPSRAATPR